MQVYHDCQCGTQTAVYQRITWQRNIMGRSLGQRKFRFRTAARYPKGALSLHVNYGRPGMSLV